MIARIIEWSARWRGAVLFGTAALTAFSVWAIRNTPLDAIPDLSDPQVIVFTEWMGRSPPLVEDQVTYPIASSLLAAPKVTDVRGLSMFGMSFIYVLFEEGTDLYWARSRVLEYLSTLRDRLPPGVTPVLGPDATAIGWVFQYALVDKSGKNDLAELRTFQDFSLRYALASVPGVAEVAPVGGFSKQYQIEVDPESLRAYNLTLADVAAAVRRSNADVGGRVLEMSGREYFVRGRGYVKDLGDLEKVTLGTGPAGTPITVAQVGRVSFGPDIRRGVAELDGEGETVGGVVVMRYGENANAVIDRVKQKLESLKPSFPPGVEVKVVYDRSDLIGRAIETLRTTLFEEMIVVSLVILIFLLHLRSTLVPVLMLPVAVAAAFIPMYFLGITSNIMSLGGIAIAIGAMVDAAIVLVENAHKKLEHAPPGVDRREVLIAAAKEVGPAIFFSLLIITVAFLPIFTLVGQGGRLFKPLAYTKTFAMALSALLSITLAPALMTWFIRGRIFDEKRHPVSRLLIALYKPFVYVALRNPKTTIGIGLAAVISAVPLATKIGSEFMPPLNEGDILYMPTTFPNISIEEAKKYLQIQDRILRGFPEVERVLGKAGRVESPTDPAPLSMVETVVKLKPKEAWRPGMTWEKLTAEMNRALQLPGWTNAFTMPIKTRVDMLTTGIRTPIGVKVFGTDLEQIERTGMELERVLSAIPGTRSVYSDRTTGGLYIDIVPDREAIARYGLNVQDVHDVVEAAIGGMAVGVTVEGRNRFSINVRYPRDLRDSLDRLRRVLVPARGGGGGSSAMPAGMRGDAAPVERVNDRNGRDARAGGGPWGPRLAQAGMSDVLMPGTMQSAAPPASEASGATADLAQIPLGQLADIRVVPGPPMIRDEAGLLVGYVYVDIDTGRRDIGGYVAEAKEKVAREMKLPPGSYLKWTGQYELLEQMWSRMKVVVPLTLLIIVLLLWLQFQSFTEVAIVLLSIPFALVGSVWLLWLLDYRMSTAVWVGIIALTGLAAQTGIVMIVYIDNAYLRRKAAGKIRDLNDIIWAHMEGTVMRVRPKLMTVATMMIGLVPLLWATGSGADVMKRIAAPMVGGLVTSAMLTLEIIPVIYTYWRYAQLKREQRLAGGNA